MIRGALLALALASAAAAAPLDDWLAGVADREVVVVVPRVDRVAGPVFAALERLKSQPTLAELSAALTEAAPFPTDLAAHERLGLAPEGPMLLASGPVAFLPVPDASKSARYLEALGLDGVSRHVDGMLVVAPNDAALDRALAGKAGASPLADCPRKKGDADLFAWWSVAGIGRACATLRIDPGRVRADARVVFTPAQPLEGWLGAPDEGLVGHLGPRVTTALAVHLGPAARARLAEQVDSPLWRLFRGGVAVGAGPTAGTVTAAIRVAHPEQARAELGRQLQAQKKAQVVADAGGWRVRLDDSEAWVGVRGDVLLATTGSPLEGDHRAALTGPGRLDGALLRGAPVTWYLRLAGPPHAGRAFTDALSPTLTTLGLRPDGLEQMSAAAGFVLAHLSEAGLSVAVEGGALVCALEVMTL